MRIVLPQRHVGRGDPSITHDQRDPVALAPVRTSGVLPDADQSRAGRVDLSEGDPDTESSTRICRPTTVEEGSHMKLEHVMEDPLTDGTVAGVPIERDDRVTPANPPRPAPARRPQVAPRAGAWGLSLAVLITGTFMSVLDTSVVNVAMSVLSKEFGTSADSVQWVSTVYNLAEGVAIPTGAWLGARFGLKRV